MANELTGKILVIGEVQTIPGRDPSRPFYKRELVIDTTRHDPYTGERSQYENTPLLEFGGDIVRELDHYNVGDIVRISFEVMGKKYTKGDKEMIFTRVRPYKIEMVRGGHSSQPQPQPQQVWTQPTDDIPF